MGCDAAGTGVQSRGGTAEPGARGTHGIFGGQGSEWDGGHGLGARPGRQTAREVPVVPKRLATGARVAGLLSEVPVVRT